MSDKQKLVIDRNVWLRGDEDTSTLLDDEGKRCCVGIYLQTCGVPDEAMLYAPDVESLVEFNSGVGILPERARWLYTDEDGDVAKVENVYAVNDEPELSDAEREVKIARKFARHGVEVSFVN